MLSVTRRSVVVSSALAALLLSTVPTQADAQQGRGRGRGQQVAPPVQAPRQQAPRQIGPGPRGGQQNRSYAYSRPYVQRRPVFTRPYYSFRPQFSIGFGINLGRPVAYPFRSFNPVGFYNYRIGPVPAYRNYGNDWYYGRVGGVSFDISPRDAAVFIDGDFVGYADDFGPGQMPLTLSAGFHRVELEARSRRTVSFNLTVVAGQVLPYRGDLPRDRW